MISNHAIVAEVATHGVVRGCFNGWNWTGFTTVHSNNFKKTSSIRICAFDMSGHRNRVSIDVQICNSKGKQIKTVKDFKTTANITLPKGYGEYKVRIKPHNFHDNHKCNKWNKWWADGKNFDNKGGCVYWSFDGKSNCWV